MISKQINVPVQTDSLLFQFSIKPESSYETCIRATAKLFSQPHPGTPPSDTEIPFIHFGAEKCDGNNTV